ncbi:serine carboxypeptidase [Ancylostoma caninum]|uniref:Carboxypeptidase n=1 Tax=Ancylostoma caninum TaxID=29170 RepID=A0A368FHA8_ANCCA|nr:serine carboxypeptidase [Ancylostoma caninum]
MAAAATILVLLAISQWFVESQNNPATDPVLVWLTGGPGCSGLSALLTEWGPFMVNPDGATLTANPYSWNKKASILTLEAPAGVGYSFATDGNIKTGDDQTASENWEALVAFFNQFPQYRNNDFYITGESYGGECIIGFWIYCVSGEQKRSTSFEKKIPSQLSTSGVAITGVS